MARVRRVAAWLLGGVIGLLVLATAALFFVTQTGAGVSWLRSYAIGMARDAVHGTLYLGRLDIGFGCAVSTDSIEIRDQSDSLMLATGPVRARCDLASLLLRRRLVLRGADVTRPVMILREDTGGVWNVSRVFPPDTTILRDTIRGPGVIMNDVRIVDGSFLLEMPWSPDEALSGAERDSAVAAALALPGSEIVRGDGSYVRRWRWLDINLAAPRISLATVTADVDLRIERLSLVETDPALALRDSRGTIRLVNDTITLDLPSFALTGSRGALAGTLALEGEGGNLGYDLRMRGDTVALADVAWITDLLPREGGGRANVHIVNGDDPSILEYRVSDMDVVSTDSHLRGAITFGVGGPLLAVTDLALDLQPMDMDLVRILTGGPLPYDFQGTLTGRLDASGGTLDRFFVDSARVRYNDRTVAGAVSLIEARGGLDMSRPGATAFRAFTLDVQPFDVRSWTRQDSTLPPLSGTLTGRVTLDSVFTDIRIRNLDAYYREGPAPPLHALGGGRITFLDDGLRYNLDLRFEPLSFGALATAYPVVDSLSPASGALHIEGITSDLAIAGTLAGPGGTMTVDGRFDIEQPRWAGVGTVRATDLDLAEASTRNGLPHTRLDFFAEADMAGDSLANLVGHLDLDVDSSSAEGVNIVSATSRLVFADGRARVDSLEAFTSVGDVRANGAVSLTRDRFDSLFVVALSDSVSRVLALLGALTDSTALPDSTEVGGSLGITAVLAGSVDSLELNGTARAQSLRAFGTYEAYAQADIALQGLPSEPHGTLEVVVDSGMVGGVLLRSVLASATFGGLDDIRYSLRAETGDTIQLRAAGSAMLGDSTRRVITLDSLYFASYRLPRSALTLAAPTQVTLRPGRITLDSTVIDGLGSGIRMYADVPDSGTVVADLLVDGIVLSRAANGNRAAADTATLLDVVARARGTAARPELELLMRGRPQFEEAAVDSLFLSARFADGRLNVAGVFAAENRVIARVDAQTPATVTLRPFAARLGDGSLTGRLLADSIDLARFAGVIPVARISSGWLSTNVLLSGTVRRPLLAGGLQLGDGAVVSPRLRLNVFDARGDIRFNGDTIAIRELSVAAGPRDASHRAIITGRIAIDSVTNPSINLALRTNDFPVGGIRSTDGVEMDAALALRGRFTQSRLTGSIVAERGVLRLPALFARDVVGSEDPEFTRLLDSLTLRRDRGGPTLASRFLDGLTIDGVRVVIGENVWLRSPEVNVNLGGSLALATARIRRYGAPTRSVLTLDGTLTMRRGTYRLEAGVIARTFQLEEGSLTFRGGADFNPELDLNAVYDVSTAPSGPTGRSDVRIRATIGGTVQAPTLALSDAGGSGLSQESLLSYLITGQAQFDVGSRDAYAQLATAELLSRATGALAERVGGGFFDVVNVTTGSVGTARSRGQSGLGALAASRFGFGKQLNDRTYVYLTAGVCGLRGLASTSDQFSPQQFTEAIGVTLDYRIAENLRLQLAQEPGSQDLACAATSGSRGFAPSPRQWGGDILKIWRF